MRFCLVIRGFLRQSFLPIWISWEVGGTFQITVLDRVLVYKVTPDRGGASEELNEFDS